MKIFKDAFATLQKIGKSLMLPVSVLPVAGILLGVGSAKLSWLPEIVSNVMAQSGGAIFSNLPLIFAIGVALGLANNDGVAALAAVVGYAVLQAALGVFATILGIETHAVMGIKSIETGVLGGILIGGIAAAPSIASSRFNSHRSLAFLPVNASFQSSPHLRPLVLPWSLSLFGRRSACEFVDLQLGQHQPVRV